MIPEGETLHAQQRRLHTHTHTHVLDHKESALHLISFLFIPTLHGQTE